MDQLNGSADHGILGAINQCLPWASGTLGAGMDASAWLWWNAVPEIRGELVDLGTATLDQNNQHNGEQNAGDDANESNAVHIDSSW
jgi:hypothetical protein